MVVMLDLIIKLVIGQNRFITIELLVWRISNRKVYHSPTPLPIPAIVVRPVTNMRTPRTYKRHLTTLSQQTFLYFLHIIRIKSRKCHFDKVLICSNSCKNITNPSQYHVLAVISLLSYQFEV